jgi:hypothetical protein
MKTTGDNYYGFDHEAVSSVLKGNLSYLGTTTVFGEYRPVAIYRAANPDRSKGHKEFVLLQTEEGKLFVRGRELSEIEPFLHVNAVLCTGCGSTIYSTMRHHMAACECGKTAIDGGREYQRLSFDADTPFEEFRLNLLTGERE